MSVTPKHKKNRKNSSKSTSANKNNSKTSPIQNVKTQKSPNLNSKNSENKRYFNNKNEKNDNLGYSPLKNPFILKKTKTMKKKLKLKNIKNIKSFDDRLKNNNDSNIPISKMTSMEKKLNEKNKFKVFSPTPGILRHKNWKTVRKSSYSLAFNNKKSKLNSSNNSKNSTLDSLNLKNNFNKSNQSYGEEVLTANTGRRDQFKNPIIRGKKRHKVSFARETKTINVENWKKINSKLTMKARNNKGLSLIHI